MHQQFDHTKVLAKNKQTKRKTQHDPTRERISGKSAEEKTRVVVF